MPLSTKTIIEELLSKVGGNPRAMIRLAGTMRAKGDEAGAIALCRAVLARAPDDAEVVAIARTFLAKAVRGWHFRLLEDEARTLAYQAAIERAVKPGMRVLEIGTGTGVLAMMAARAGAAQVHTCEANPMIAETARAVIAANGLADRVHVIAKHSSAIDPAADMGGRADLLVSEILASDVLSEQVLPSHDDAIARLLTPDAPVIPRAAGAMVALAEHDRPDRWAYGEAYGFDFAAFNQLQRPAYRLPIADPSLRLRSDDAVLFDFDLASRRPIEPGRASLDLVSRGGRVNGVIQWLSLDLDGVGQHDVKPGARPFSSWMTVFHTFASPIDTVAGQVVAVHASHDRERLTIWTG